MGPKWAGGARRRCDFWLAIALRYAHRLAQPQQRRFQTGEAEVVCAVQPGAGECEGMRVTRAGGVLDGRATREAETKQARALVECLTGGVVKRAPKVAEA